MKKNYTVHLGNAQYRVEEEGGNVSVNGKPVDVSFMKLSQDGLLLSFGNRHFEVFRSGLNETNSHHSLNVNGREISVHVEDERDALLKRFETDGATKLHASVIKAPMPGKISRILVSQGELVEAGQGVLILEAMKMENEIKTSTAGIVKAVHVQQSNAVEKGAVLIEIQ